MEGKRSNDAFTVSQVLVKAVFTTKEQFKVNAGTGGDLNGMMKTHLYRMTVLTALFCKNSQITTLKAGKKKGVKQGCLGGLVSWHTGLM